MNIVEEINRLKKEKDVVVLAHYYVTGDVQDIADYVGDSYFLAKKAKEMKNQNILLCGVSFMGESAKILNPSKRVLLPEIGADCPMAHMVDIEKIHRVREEYPDVSVVCYVNSTAEIKAESDVCVTSSNAVRVVSKLPNKHIFFIPDNNLAHFVAKQVPDKEFIYNDGYCHVHNGIKKSDVLEAKKLFPGALVLTHPECTMDVVEMSDFVGSTSEIIAFASQSEAKDFIVCTEVGVFHELEKKNPDKSFHVVKISQTCPNMKKITLKKVYDVLEKFDAELSVEEELCRKAGIPLERMLELAE